MFSDFARRIAGVDSRLLDITRHDSPGSDYNIVADGDGQYGGMGADGDTVADTGGSPLRGVAPSRPAFAKQIVDEHRTVRNKAVFADGDELTNKGM